MEKTITVMPDAAARIPNPFPICDSTILVLGMGEGYFLNMCKKENDGPEKEYEPENGPIFDILNTREE